MQSYGSGDTLLVRNLTSLGLTEKFIKEVIVFLKKKTNEKRFEDFSHFESLYIDKIIDTPRENDLMLDILYKLSATKKINFS